MENQELERVIIKNEKDWVENIVVQVKPRLVYYGDVVRKLTRDTTFVIRLFEEADESGKIPKARTYPITEDIIVQMIHGKFGIGNRLDPHPDRYFNFECLVNSPFKIEYKNALLKARETFGRIYNNDFNDSEQAEKCFIEGHEWFNDQFAKLAKKNVIV